MIDAIPEGVGIIDLRTHALHCGLAATLINLSSDHSEAEFGSPEEAAAEQALLDHLQAMYSISDDTPGQVLLILASLIAETGDEPTVQRWFDAHGEMIRQALQ